MQNPFPIPPRPSRRLLLAAAGATLLGACVQRLSGITDTPPRLRLIAEARWLHRANHLGTPVGGLSGIDYDAREGKYLLLCDDRSDLAPARAYSMQWPKPEGGAPPVAGDLVVLKQADGTPWANRRQARAGVPVPDPEALRWRPDTATLLWASEGDVARGFGPALYESRPDGTLVREIPLPEMFRPDPQRGRGTRDNLGLEGLALTPDGSHAWLAMEGPLAQDGPIATVDAAGGPCRFTQVALADGRAVRQIAYQPDAIPRRPLLPGTYADNGVSEVLMIDVHRMLVLERAYATGVGNSLRLYEIDTRDGSDTLALATLAPDNHRAAPKKLVADFATLGLGRLDNTEGMCWGPALANGNRMLVVVSDDNFNPLQITQFAAFEFTG